MDLCNYLKYKQHLLSVVQEQNYTQLQSANSSPLIKLEVIKSMN